MAKQLALRSVESFLPLCRTLRYWKNRWAQVGVITLPELFVCSLLCCRAVACAYGSRVVHIVTFQGVPAVRRLRASHCASAVMDRAVSIAADGRRMRIKAGPLKGLEEFWCAEKDRCESAFQSISFQRSASVEVRPEDLQYPAETTDPIPKSPGRIHR